MGSKDFQHICFCFFSFLLSPYVKVSRIFCLSLGLQSLPFFIRIWTQKGWRQSSLAKQSKVLYIQGQQIFQLSVYITLLLFTYISTLRARNLGNKRLISPSFQISKNILLLLVLLLLTVLLMLYFYIATFSTCPLQAYNQLQYIHTLFPGPIHFVVNKSAYLTQNTTKCQFLPRKLQCKSAYLRTKWRLKEKVVIWQTTSDPFTHTKLLYMVDVAK